MSTVSHRVELRHADVEIRRASRDEIDILCDIDLDASRLFERAGMYLEPASEPEISAADRARWLRCLEAGTVLLAVDAAGEPVGFAAAAMLDDEPYLDQLSVRTKFMRMGVGTALLNAILAMTGDAGGRALWLTTYRHLPWNRAFYERAGFLAVPESECGPEISRELDYQRRWLPLPGQRVVMRKASARGRGRSTLPQQMRSKKP
jgi:GNAT superfamily N-acetyltransferase